MTQHPRRAASRAPGAVLAVLLLATGCGASLPGPDDRGARASSAGGVPTLAEVDAADLLSDPREWQGPGTAVVSDTGADPVADEPRPELPVTLTDVQGTEVTVTDVSRVLALDVYGTLSRTVVELGLADRLVGRDVSTQLDELDDLPLVTQNGHDLNAEAILALDPTVVLTDTSLGPWDVVLQLRDAGIPVVVTDSHRGLDNLTALTEQVAAALGVPRAGQRLARRTERQVDAVRARIEEVAPDALDEQLRTVFLYARGQAGVYYMFGEGSGADALIEAVGAYDVAGEIGWAGMKPVTDEGIVAAQPDLVLMMSGGLESAGGVEGLLERFPALASTPAGERRRFVDMDDAQVLGYGPGTAAVLDALAVAVYAPGALR